MQTPPSKKRESGALAEVWRAHNALLDYVRAIAVQQSGSQGVRVTQTSNGTLLKVSTTSQTETTSELRRATITAITSASIECDYEEDTLIAGKPHIFRNVDATRSISVQGRTITESIYPAYAVGDVVTIGRVSGDDYEWIDVTVGRCWRHDLREFAVCIAGDDNWRILVAGSAPFRPT